MNRTGIILIAFLATIVAVLFGLSYFVKKPYLEKAKPEVIEVPKIESKDGSNEGNKTSAIQQELNDLSAKMVADLRNEERLNLNMVAQLRSYREMLRQIDTYAKKIERDIDVIEEISKNEFQDDVKLQASLFAGKKPELVAKHLEEFRASRVGAILAKMKEKEASVVMDIWAGKQDPKISAFYREVVSAYLNNRRRDANPELFNKLVQENPSRAQTAPGT